MLQTITPNPEVEKPLEHEVYFKELFKKEFKRLDKNNQTYLDYTGSALYGASQIKMHNSWLKNHVFGNPHSTNPTSRLATLMAESSRSEVLSFFNAQDYLCIFTQNASHAIRIVGESYPFDSKSPLLMLADNHNSINGLRSFAKQKGANFSYSGLNANLTADYEQFNNALEKSTTGIICFSSSVECLRSQT
ncbi:MAG: aminotransferase class V-fold PLP-dependent enzyme [Saprospiraceae bacterium]|nr:aminotransferase class V-fold PLP-dependent enzyme [Saprospiraceae bacterium]